MHKAEFSIHKYDVLGLIFFNSHLPYIKISLPKLIFLSTHSLVFLDLVMQTPVLTAVHLKSVEK